MIKEERHKLLEYYVDLCVASSSYEEILNVFKIVKIRQSRHLSDDDLVKQVNDLGIKVDLLRGGYGSYCDVMGSKR
ncbi:hypothetical protein [Caudoviricetes sp.]|nr:hypothetical protein [Caudoviricetes sp.]